uniref:Achaete-Scute a-like2 achaete-scute like protein n=1 Tax=Phallusia mammillata TaxID=59560 RepID=A0A6F9D6D7_9ASCI|nr:Achaete-Scute a-like2 achaete-scute like protein [Phallusia mammillata]
MVVAAVKCKSKILNPRQMTKDSNMASLHASASEQNMFQVAYDKTWKAQECTNKQQSNGALTTYTLHIKNDSITATPEPLTEVRRGGGVAGKNPSSVARRNARERRRIRNVNSAFDELRQHVPNGERNRKKISKVDTLQSAIEYIKALEELVQNRRSKTTAAAEAEASKENAPKLNKCTKRNEQSPSPPDTPEHRNNGSDCDDVIFVKELSNFAESPAPNNEQKSAMESSGKKVQRPAALTESMLKAFDVMLQKCASERKASASRPESVQTLDNAEEQTKNPCQDTSATSNFHTDNCHPDIQPKRSDSGFSELFEDQGDTSSESSFRPRQSSLELDQSPPSMDFVASPIHSETLQATVAETSVGGFLQQLEDFTPSFEQINTPNSQVSTFEDAQLPDEWQKPLGRFQQFYPEAIAENCPAPQINYLPLPASNANWPNGVQEMEHQNFHEPFDVQTVSVPSGLDQINPTLDFFPGPDSNNNYSFVETTPTFMNMNANQGCEQPTFSQSLFSARGVDESFAVAQW